MGKIKNDEAMGKCMSTHGTIDSSKEHADGLNRKDLYKYFTSQDNISAWSNVNKTINFSSSSNWENLGNSR